MNEHNERLMSFASVIFMLAVWVLIIAWLIFHERPRPNYRAAFDQAFLRGERAMKAGDKTKVIGDRYNGYQGVIDHISPRGIHKKCPIVVRLDLDVPGGFLAGFAESELELIEGAA